MQQWEYYWFRADQKGKVLLKFEDGKKRTSDEYLDSCGKVGWELVSVIDDAHARTYFFKRPKEEI